MLQGRPVWLPAGVIACLAVAAGALLLANGQMDSLYAYRSPLRDRPPAPGQPVGGAAAGRVVFVLADALREDTSLDAEVMPYLAELRARGAWATMHSRPPSFSQPGYTTLLTGAWPDINDGAPINLDYDEIRTWTQDDLFSAAHRAGLRTAVSGYYWFEKMIPQGAVDASFYTPGEDGVVDEGVVAAALPWLQRGEGELVLIHLDQVDYAGHHEGGPRDPRWNAAARRVDDLIRRIGGTLDFTRDTLLVVSDHGQIDRGGHGGPEPVCLIEPFILAGAGVVPGRYPDVQMVDVAPTVSALLGAAIPASAQGRILTEMLALAPGQGDAISAAAGAQQRQLAEAYLDAIGGRASLPSGGAAGDYPSAMQEARQARLNGERWPRAGVAAGLLATVALIVYRMRSRHLGAMLAGTLVYVLAFNACYALLGDRAYSFSSVASAGDLLGGVAAFTLVALAAGWLVLLAATRLHRRAPRDAARLTLGWVLLTLVIAELPLPVSLVLNGAAVTWALPDLPSFFVGFLAVVQGLFLSAFGLLLAAASAVLARRASVLQV